MTEQEKLESFLTGAKGMYSCIGKSFVTNMESDCNKEQQRKYATMIHDDMPQLDAILKILGANYTIEAAYLNLRKYSAHLKEMIDEIESKELREYIHVAMAKVKAEDEVNNAA